MEDCYDPQSGKIPFAFFALGIIVACLALIPPAIVYKARNTRSPNPKLHLILDMDFQNKYKAQSKSAFFADGKTSRPQVAGTVARGQLHEENEHLHSGKVDGKWAETFPFEVNEAHMKRGQERFNIYCAVCHGPSGKGDGLVSRRADQLMRDHKESDWVAPSNLTAENARKMTVGELYWMATTGIRSVGGPSNMAGYAAQISDEDRWNIILYVRALQRSSVAQTQDIPADQIDILKSEAGRLKITLAEEAKAEAERAAAAKAEEEKAKQEAPNVEPAKAEPNK